MHKLVQIVRFESARKLPKVPEGHPCGNVYGLAFKLEVHVEGKVDPETGFVIDFGHIESAIKPTYDLRTISNSSIILELHSKIKVQR